MIAGKQRVVITGGAGYIGSLLAARLVKEKYVVTIFDTFFFGKTPIRVLKNNVRIIQGDVRNPPQNLFRGVDTVIHLAALSNDPTAEFNPKANEEINTIGTETLATLAKKSGVKRFILASSCSIYDLGLTANTTIKTESSVVRPRNPYSKSKYFAEQAILRLANASFSPIILRKGTVFGYSPRMRYDLIVNTMVRDAICQKKLHIFSQGKQWRSLVAIEDVVEAYVLAIKKPRKTLHKKIINIASENYRVIDVAKEVQKVFKDSFHTHIKLVYTQMNKPDRSYRVSTKRSTKLLGFKSQQTLSMSIFSLTHKILKKKELRQFKNPRFYNIETMKPILERMKLVSV